MSDYETTTATWPEWADDFIVGHLRIHSGDSVGYVLAPSLNPQVFVYRAEELANPKPFPTGKTLLQTWPEKPTDAIEAHLANIEPGDTIRYEYVDDAVNLPDFVSMIEP